MADSLKRQNVKTISKIVSDETGLVQADCEAVCRALLKAVTESIKRGEFVHFPQLGTFRTIQRSERLGRNPKTGEEVIIPAHHRVKFKACHKLFEAVKHRKP